MYIIKGKIIKLFLVISLFDILYGAVCPGKCIDDPKDCRVLGGKICGYCVNEHVCCDFNENKWGTCGSTLSNVKVSYFRSPSFPKSSSGDLVCTFQLELSPKTIGVRIDFVDFKIDTVSMDAAIPICGSDFWFIQGFKHWAPDPRCGNFSGYSILVETEKEQKMIGLVFVMSSADYKWNIRLTEIREEEVNSLNAFLYNTVDVSQSKNEQYKSLSSTLYEIPTTAKTPKKPYLSESVNYQNQRPFYRLPAPLPLPIPPIMPPYIPPQIPHHAYFQRSQDSGKNSESSGIPMLRIAGGETAQDYSIPWQVSIQSIAAYESTLCSPPKNMSVHICGGTIIGENYILSSAHCFYSQSRYPHPTISVEQLKVVVGEQDMCQEDEVAFTKEYGISQIFLHYNYFAKEILNDIAILKLTEKIEYNQGVKPIALPDSDFDVNGKSNLLSGWGSCNLDENISYPSVLQKTEDLVLLPDEECQKRQKAYLNLIYGNDTIGNGSQLNGKYRGVLNSGICARGKTDKVEAGYGDSGGPLVAFSHNNNSTPILIGIVSHMRPEVDQDTNSTFHLDYFVKVSAFKKWILLGMVS